MKTTRLLLVALLLGTPSAAVAQSRAFTHADTLRGTIGPERAWWDVVHYDLNVRVSPRDSSIAGSNTLRYRVLGPAREMQIDLQAPLVLDSVVQERVRLAVRRDGNAYFARPQSEQSTGSVQEVTAFYHGRPQVAVQPPWDGGFAWSRDPQGAPWIATANQGIGASIWWPNKDHQSDEPDSMRIRFTVPSPLVAVSNGRMGGTPVTNADGTRTYEWVVKNPINNYGVALYAGSYVSFDEKYAGEPGELDLQYWVLPANLEKAKAQFAQVRPMLACFENWFGPYPFYEDGFKLVDAPYLGMEHQSAIAYGNQYRNGYLGSDLSGTGRGLTWDYIIIHEAAHEWFGNNITTQDIADMWVHEGFGDYAESLYIECTVGKEAAAEYVIGSRTKIGNASPVVGPYGVNQEGSGDMYFKGANMLHTLRQIVNDDAQWKAMLRGLNANYGHLTVTTKMVEDYMSRVLVKDLSRFFDQYLRRAKLPVFEYTLRDRTLSYRWRAEVAGFDMPIKVTVARDRYVWVTPGADWKTISVEVDRSDFHVDPNFYVQTVEAR